MTIKEFAEKYNLEKRTVDYFTTIGIFHPKEAKSENTNFKVYRDYDEQCEREAKIVVICLAAGMKSEDILTWTKVILYDTSGKIPSMMRKFFTELIDAEKAKATRLYDDALMYIEKGI